MQSRLAGGGWLRSPRAVAAVQVALALASLLFLAFLFYQGRGQLQALSWRLDYPWLGAAFLLYSLDLGLAVAGWHLITQHLGGSAGFWVDAHIFTLANPAKRLPGRIWGFASRLYLYRAQGIPTLNTSLALLAETAMMACGGLLALLPLSLSVEPLSSVVPVWLAWALAALGLALLLLPHSLGWLLGLLARLRRIERLVPPPIPSATLFLWLAPYVALWLVGGLVLYAFARAMYPFPLEAVPSLLGIWIVAGLVGLLSLVVPVAFGLTEASLAYLLSFQVPGSLAVVIALGLRVFLTVAEVLWMLAALALGGRRQPGAEAMEEV